MGVLGNLDHERFCQAFHKRVWAGERKVSARVAAYLETMYAGDQSDPKAAADAVAPNARRLVQRKDVSARIAELADYAAKLAGIDAGWAMVQLDGLRKQARDFNLDDYLAPPDANGLRYYDLGRVSREQMGQLSELTIETDTKIVESDDDRTVSVRTDRIKLKGPDKLAEQRQILALMARIAGWEAPKKIAPTDATGTGPAHYVISERPLSDDEWERSRAVPA